MRLVLVELEKLRTVRSAWVLFAAGVLLPLPIAIVALTQAGDFASSPQDVLDLVVLPVVIAAALAALACAREFEQRTITVAFMLEPRRERVIAAKAAAAAIVAIAMAALFCAVTLGVAAVWISSSGGSWAWSGGQTAGGIAGALTVTAAGAVAGTGFGGVARHAAGAIALLIGVYFVVEGLLAERFGVWHDYGVAAAAAALTEPANGHAYTFLGGLLVIAVSSLVYLAIGVGVVRRADV